MNWEEKIMVGGERGISYKTQDTLYIYSAQHKSLTTQHKSPLIISTSQKIHHYQVRTGKGQWDAITVVLCAGRQ